METKLTYTTDTMNKVLNYLATRPYKEVVDLIGLVQSPETPTTPEIPSEPQGEQT